MPCKIPLSLSNGRFTNCSCLVKNSHGQGYTVLIFDWIWQCTGCRIRWFTFIEENLFCSWDGWNCNARHQNDENIYNLLCQKGHDFQFENNDGQNRILPDEFKCIDFGVKYKSPKRHQLEKIKRVGSADLCRKKCSETDGCLFWTWLEKRRKNICKLKSGVKNTGFRREKDNAVSGSMLGDCSTKELNRWLFASLVFQNYFNHYGD